MAAFIASHMYKPEYALSRALRRGHRAQRQAHQAPRGETDPHYACASRVPSPLGHDRCGIGFNTSAWRNGEEGAALDSDAVCPPIVR
jgi:hypothetical protein